LCRVDREDGELVEEANDQDEKEEEEKAVAVLEEEDDEEGEKPLMLSLDPIMALHKLKEVAPSRHPHVSLIARTAWGHSSESSSLMYRGEGVADARVPQKGVPLQL